MYGARGLAWNGTSVMKSGADSFRAQVRSQNYSSHLRLCQAVACS